MIKNMPQLIYVLEGLIPYTKANLNLTYRPNIFFNELEQLSKNQAKRTLSSSSIKTTYYRAKKNGYIGTDSNGVPFLTKRGETKLKIYTPNKLKKAKLLVTFDIKESDRHKRTELRQILRAAKFEQVQRSVWISDYDSRKILRSEIRRLLLEKEVVIYEAFELD